MDKTKQAIAKHVEGLLTKSQWAGNFGEGRDEPIKIEVTVVSNLEWQIRVPTRGAGTRYFYVKVREAL